ncbi:MAG: phosphatase PAP2 family protein [Gemmatimonadota bacterium]
MNWEAEAVRWANGLVGRSAVLDGIMAQLSDGWIPWALIALAIGYWVWRERRRAFAPLLSLTGVVLLADFAGAQLKAAVGRPRPCQVFEVWNRVGGCGTAFSMPSNHVLNTAAAAGFLQVLYPKSGWIMWPLVVVQAFSRMFVAAHYPTDVLVGALVGSALGVGLGLLLAAWRRRRGGLDLAPEA